MNEIMNEIVDVNAGDIVKRVKSTKGVIDVIGLDVLELHDDIKNAAEAEEYIKKHVNQTIDFLEIGDRKFAVRTMISDLNRVVSLIPEDMDSKVAIPIQIKIAEVLQQAGLNVNIKEDIEKELATEEESCGSCACEN